MDRHDALDADLAGPGVYRNLRDLAAERVYPKAVRVGAARARAVDGGVAELPRYLDHVDVERAVVRPDPAAAHGEIVGRDLEHVACELQQRPSHLGRCGPHRGHHRRRRLRAARDRPVDVRLRVAADNGDVVERQAEFLRRDDGGRSQGPGADVLNTCHDLRMARRVEPDRRMRRRAAAAPPDLRRTPHAAQQPVRLQLSQPITVLPVGELRGPVVAREKRLARVLQSTSLVAVDVVPTSKLERVEIERERKLVDGLLEDRHALHHPGCPERVLRSQIRLQRERHRARVRHLVQRQRRLQHGHHPAALAHRDQRVRIDGDERAVAASAQPNRLARPRTAPAGELLPVPVVHQPHRSPRQARKLRSHERLPSRALLRSEAAADVLADHTHLIGTEAERLGELVPRRKHALRRDVRRQPVAVPQGDGGVRLERRLQVRRRLELQLDPYLGGLESRLDVPA